VSQSIAASRCIDLKTKNFHWHMRGAHFRDHHLLLDEQAEELFKATDAIAERTRKIGESAIRSIGDIARHQPLHDSDTNDAPAITMLQMYSQTLNRS
jgi:starvation-inducible DNA-binding protein